MTEQAGDGYIYMASPYTHPEPFVMELRYIHAAKVLAYKLKRREWTYSPIIHCHELAKTYGLPKDAQFWREYDFAMLSRAKRLEVLRLEGWETSVGIVDEIEEARRINLEVIYL